MDRYPDYEMQIKERDARQLQEGHHPYRCKYPGFSNDSTDQPATNHPKDDSDGTDKTAKA